MKYSSYKEPAIIEDGQTLESFLSSIYTSNSYTSLQLHINVLTEKVIMFLNDYTSFF